jgi:uncharacterized protein (DUF1330 family)
MSVYLIIEIAVKNREMYLQYVQKVPPIIEKHGGRYLARGGAITPLMGDWNPERIILITDFRDGFKRHIPITFSGLVTQNQGQVEHR